MQKQQNALNVCESAPVILYCGHIVLYTLTSERQRDKLTNFSCQQEIEPFFNHLNCVPFLYAHFTHFHCKQLNLYDQQRENKERKKNINENRQTINIFTSWYIYYKNKYRRYFCTFCEIAEASI